MSVPAGAPRDPGLSKDHIPSRPIGTLVSYRGASLLKLRLLTSAVQEPPPKRGNVSEFTEPSRRRFLQLLAMLKKRIEEWFGGEDRKRYFFVDRGLGAVASYPDDFFGIAEVNDHHFWYGYWIRAAAEIARTMLAYPVQRQRLPLIWARISPSPGSTPRRAASSSGSAAMTMPGVQ